MLEHVGHFGTIDQTCILHDFHWFPMVSHTSPGTYSQKCWTPFSSLLKVCKSVFSFGVAPVPTPASDNIRAQVGGTPAGRTNPHSRDFSASASTTRPSHSSATSWRWEGLIVSSWALIFSRSLSTSSSFAWISSAQLFWLAIRFSTSWTSSAGAGSFWSAEGCSSSLSSKCCSNRSKKVNSSSSSSSFPYPWVSTVLPRSCHQFSNAAPHSWEVKKCFHNSWHSRLHTVTVALSKVTKRKHV